MQLSVIIVTYNPGSIIIPCLESVLKEVADLDTEVIVVDNVSQDGTPQTIEQKFPQVKLIRSQENRGFAAGNNQGLKEATGKYRLLLNPDVIVLPGALSTMMAFLDANPQVGIIGPRTYDNNHQVVLTALGPFTALTVVWHYLGLSRLFPYYVYGQYRGPCEQATAPFAASWVQASCLMFRASVYDQVGGLDEELFLFGEDPDFCDRATRQGWSTYFLPTAEVVHNESTTISRYPLIKMRHYHRSPLYYFHKRKRYFAVLILKLGFTAELLGKLILFSMRREGFRAEACKIVLTEVWQF